MMEKSSHPFLLPLWARRGQRRFSVPVVGDNGAFPEKALQRNGEKIRRFEFVGLFWLGLFETGLLGVVLEQVPIRRIQRLSACACVSPI